MQYLLTKGLAAGGRGNGARATNMIYTNMLFALGLDKAVFGQSPGWWSLGGSGLILGSAIFVAVRKGQVPEGGGGERDVEMFGRRGSEGGNRGGNGSGRLEEEMAMLGGDANDEEEEGLQPDSGLEIARNNGVVETGREAEAPLNRLSDLPPRHHTAS